MPDKKKTRKKKSANPTKGGVFERYVAKKLSLWWSNNERDDLFWRTHGSGSRHTVRAKKGIDTYGQHGDICSTHPDAAVLTEMCFIECKWYRDINFWSLFTLSKSASIYGFWNELCTKAGKAEKLPILICKQNNRPELIMIPYVKFDQDFQTQFVAPRMEGCFNSSIAEGSDYALIELQSFFKFDPKQVKANLERFSQLVGKEW